MSNVVNFSGNTTVDMDPDKVLESAKGELTEVLVIGWDKEGSLWFAGSQSDMMRVSFLLARAQHQTMILVDNAESEEE